MPQSPTNPMPVLEFAKHIGISDAHVYTLINLGVFRVLERGQKILLNPITQRPRYYHYKSLISSNPKGVTSEILREIDRLCASGAEYSLVTPESKALVEARQDLGLPTSSTAQDSLPRRINGKIAKDLPISAIENQISEMASSKLRKEQALARKAELDCDEREGRLIPREAVLKLWKDIGIKVQQAILAIPDRVAPVMAGETDGHKIHRMLTDELKHALRSLSFDLKKLGSEEEEDA